MRDQARDGIIRAAHVGHLHGVLVVPQRANVGNLSARFGIEHRAIENDFAFRAGGQFVHRAVFGDDGFDAAIFRGCFEIKIRLRALRFGEFCVDWIGDVLMPAFPRCARASALLFHGRVESRFVKLKPSVPDCIPDEVEWEAISVIEFERLVTFNRMSAAANVRNLVIGCLTVNIQTMIGG